ncbi:MAG: DUF1553 domain-containing protein [Pirellulaceae bacterium]
MTQPPELQIRRRETRDRRIARRRHRSGPSELLGASVAVWLVLSGSGGRAAEVDYLRQVKPVLRDRCYACHGALKQEGGLRLDAAALAVRGGDSGEAIQPGKPETSLLIERISAEDESERMPPEGEPLTPTQVEQLRAWIRAGAPAPAHEEPEADPQDHWAFRLPAVAPLPALRQPGWVSQQADAWILAGLEQNRLGPQRPADRRTLLRRVTLDLTGFPPTSDEQAAFLADDRPDALERVVDRLLSSPAYGERWGRHFMDIWRYSDWWGLGAEVRNSQKHIWHWRDWIIESLNQDLGYDEMVRQMLAADELYPTDLDRLRATGFLARHYFKFNRTTWLDETIEHTSKAFLGLTLNCGKCHDHKYDPFSQEEYYRLRAFFEPYQLRTDMVPGEANFEQDGIPRAFDCNLDAPTWLHVRGDDRNPDKSRSLEPALPGFLSWEPLRIEPVMLAPTAHQPGLRPWVLESYLATAERELAESQRQRAQAANDLAANKPTAEIAQAAVTSAEKGLAAATAAIPAIRVRGVADQARAAVPPPANLAELEEAAARAERELAVLQADAELARAELELLKANEKQRAKAEEKRQAARTALDNARQAAEKPGREYVSLRGALKTLESNLETEPSRSKPFPTQSTGRRSALARWIASPRHPLTARVVVNHVWGRHTGRPLVATVFDFGRKGAPPSHPELIDSLAVDFMAHGWSLKRLHRQIVLSSTYRMSSSNRTEPPSASAVPAAEAAAVSAAEQDPDNRWFWRMNSVRMEAQIVRDALLSLAGDIDRRLGGPSVPVRDDSSRRRSLYYVHSNNDQQMFLSVFDDAKVQECYRRTESIVPQQALALENSRLAQSAADAIAARIAVDAADSTSFIRQAFRDVLCFEPSASELSACEAALAAWRTVLSDASPTETEQRIRTQLVQALLNHNDFVTVR